MKIFNYQITDYGAVADGVTINTAAIQDAIDNCHAAGGGIVMIPAGDFMSGGLFLKSNVELHLAAGAILRGAQDLDAFPPLSWASHGYQISHWRVSLITALDQENIAITGMGAIDGQGADWWKQQELEAQGSQRPPLIAINNCSRVLLRDFSVANSPFWTIRFLLSSDITVDRISVRNPWNAYRNNDGINFVACRDARVSNCQLDTGDDGITLKSIPDFTTVLDGQIDRGMLHVPSENILIHGCVVRHAHGGVVIGSETVGGVRNVAVTNCVFEGTRSGIKIKASQFGGLVEHLRVNNILMRQVEIGIDLGIRPLSNPYDVFGDMRLAEVRHLHFSDITAERSHIGVRVEGQAGSLIRNVSFSNLQIEADAGIVIRHAEEIALRQVRVECRGPALLLDDARRIELDGLVAPCPDPRHPVIEMQCSSDICIRNCITTEETGVFLGLAGDENAGIVFSENSLGKVGRMQSPVQPGPVWSTTSHAFSGSVSYRDHWDAEAGEREAWLPVPRKVMEIIEDLWPREWIRKINVVCRVESGARPDVMLVERPDRRVYIIQASGLPEKLFIAEDGEIYRRIDDPDYRADRFEGD